MFLCTFPFLALGQEQPAAAGDEKIDLGPRQFTDESGRQVTAKVLRADTKTVTFNINGKYIDWPILKLSEADQEYLKKWRSRPNLVDPAASRLSLTFKPTGGVNIGVPGAGPKIDHMVGNADYRHYHIELRNNASISLKPVTLAYVIWAENANGGITRKQGQVRSNELKANSHCLLSTVSIVVGERAHPGANQPISFTDENGNRKTVRPPRHKSGKLAGIWVKVFSGTTQVKEYKELGPKVRNSNPTFQASQIQIK